ncbi:40S ribosomal protein S16 [Sparganum proliferum]
MEEFQYVDVWQIDESVPSRPECLGPTFHLKPHCPICDSCYSDLYCSACVRSGAYSVVTKSKEELSSSDLFKRLQSTSQKIQRLSMEIQRHPRFHGTPNDSTEVRFYFINSQTSSTLSMIESSKHMLSSLKSSVEDKHRKLSAIRSHIKKCQKAIDGLSRTQTNLSRHMHAIRERISAKGVEIVDVNKQLHIIRSERVKELLLCYFPINISSMVDRADTIAGVPLNIDKTNNLSGPEPTTSSHVALAHAVVAARTTAKLFDVWLPPATRKLLCLENVFSGDFALRDNLAHAYLTVTRAVQMICAVCGLTCFPADKLSWLGLSPDEPRVGTVGFMKPLTGLYVLCQAMQKLAFIGKFFDEPYFLGSDTYEGFNLFEDIRPMSLSTKQRQGRSAESPCQKGSPEAATSHNDSGSRRKFPDQVIQSRVESDEDVKSDGAHSTSLDWEFVDSDQYWEPSDES